MTRESFMKDVDDLMVKVNSFKALLTYDPTDLYLGIHNQDRIIPEQMHEKNAIAFENHLQKALEVVRHDTLCDLIETTEQFLNKLMEIKVHG